MKLEDILQKVLSENEIKEAVRSKTHLTTIQKIKMIEETLANVINPALKLVGGSCRLVDLDGSNVLIEFMGACSGCGVSSKTLKGFVEPKIKELVSNDLIVIEV